MCVIHEQIFFLKFSDIISSKYLESHFEKLILKHKTIRDNVCSVHWGCSVILGIISALEGSMSTLGYIMCTSSGVIHYNFTALKC